MPPKKGAAKKASSKAVAKRPTAKKADAILPNILPQIPQNPSQPLSLEAYQVDGKVWAMAAGPMTMLGLVDLTLAARKPAETIAKLMTFLLSGLDVQDSEDEGQWSCARYLGSGSFGRVALLVKKAPDGKIIDTLALKEAEHMWVNREATAAEMNLPIEVAIHRDVNTHDAVHTAYLRSYKYSLATRCGRLYLRHYKYGDLDWLHKAYAIYGHWLPEWFLYEILRDFCKSLRALDTPPPADTKVDLTYPEGKEGDNSIFKTIHQDIKPDNAFLDELILKEDVYNGVPARPVPVLADFGEADYTHVKDPKNPERLAGGGTPGYKPPEELRTKTYLADLEAGEETFDDEEKEAMRQFPPTANNVWGIGRIVFEMMTHIQGTDFGQALKINEDLEDFDHDYEDFAASLKFSSKLKVWHTMLVKCVHTDLVDTFPYSDELRSLVADMLHPRPHKRPTIQEIEQRAEEGLDRILNPADAGPKGQEDGNKGKGKSKKASAGRKPKLAPLYYTQEQLVKIPNGVIAWRETAPKELDWLRVWARRLFEVMDPEGPLIKQPKFMKDNGEPWDRFSDTIRTMAIKSCTDGQQIIPFGDIGIQHFKTPAEMKRAAKKYGRPAAKKAEAPKRRRGAKDDVEAEQPPKKRATKAAGKGNVVEDSDGDDPVSEEAEEEQPPPAKKGKKAPAPKKQAAKTKVAKGGQQAKRKTPAKEAEAPQEADAPTRRSMRSRKTGVSYAE